MPIRSTPYARIRAILLTRCPRCLQGPVFQTLWRMHDACPQCRLNYAPEPGFFFGAMFFSYALGLLSTLPTAVLYRVDAHWIGLGVALQLALLSPLLFRYSRVVWMHFDHQIDPR